MLLGGFGGVEGEGDGRCGGVTWGLMGLSGGEREGGFGEEGNRGGGEEV